jgi:hypothetical protein
MVYDVFLVTHDLVWCCPCAGSKLASDRPPHGRRLVIILFTHRGATADRINAPSLGFALYLPLIVRGTSREPCTHSNTINARERVRPTCFPIDDVRESRGTPFSTEVNSSKVRVGSYGEL